MSGSEQNPNSSEIRFVARLNFGRYAAYIYIPKAIAKMLSPRKEYEVIIREWQGEEKSRQ